MSICVMADISGLSLSKSDKVFLSQPEIAGIILFSRNYDNPTQLKSLCRELKALRPDLLIAVDQEGGRVQRFRKGFLSLPAMRSLGVAFACNPKKALLQAHSLGWLMAAELIHHGVDISFAPVLDLDFGRSDVIGDRAFAREAEDVQQLAAGFIDGMQDAGMSATAKHFPGHGFVKADSHLELPTDERSLTELQSQDMLPFKQLIEQQKLAAIMPAHVVYTQVDPHFTAGFSSFWLQEILRKQMGFGGLIYSDDLSMAGAAASGSPAERAIKAQQAGCNVLLICNQREAAQEIVDTVRQQGWALTTLQNMQAQSLVDADQTTIDADLYQSQLWQNHLALCSDLWSQ